MVESRLREQVLRFFLSFLGQISVIFVFPAWNRVELFYCYLNISKIMIFPPGELKITILFEYFLILPKYFVQNSDIQLPLSLCICVKNSIRNAFFILSSYHIYVQLSISRRASRALTATSCIQLSLSILEKNSGKCLCSSEETLGFREILWQTPSTYQQGIGVCERESKIYWLWKTILHCND